MAAVTAPTMAQRFTKHVKLLADSLGEKKGMETLHGLRAGGALTMALQGTNLRDIMLQGFWKSPDTALHYIGILTEIAGEEFLKAVQNDPKYGSMAHQKLGKPGL